MENRGELGLFFRLEAWVDQEARSASSHDKETLTGGGAGVCKGGGRGSKGRRNISSVSLAACQKLCQVSQATAKRPGRPGRGLKPTTGSASRAGKAWQALPPPLTGDLESGKPTLESIHPALPALKPQSDLKKTCKTSI